MSWTVEQLHIWYSSQYVKVLEAMYSQYNVKQIVVLILSEVDGKQESRRILAWPLHHKGT